MCPPPPDLMRDARSSCGFWSNRLRRLDHNRRRVAPRKVAGQLEIQGPMPRSFLDGPGGMAVRLAWGPGVTGARPLNGPWVKKHKMYIWRVCIYLYLGEP
jgi:hypothetical protein